MDRDRKQIRLLKITDITPYQIVGQLELFDLGTSNTPLYRALSYTWGVPNPTYSIIINEQEFTIRSNLFGFLQIYGPRHLDEYIWIDQICVDQSNIEERNCQVRFMPDIYRGAEEVLIWLGPNKHHLQSSPDIEGDKYCNEVCGIRQMYMDGNPNPKRLLGADVDNSRGLTGNISNDILWISDT